MFEPLFRARPWALLPNTSPLCQQASVHLADLADMPMVMLDLPGAVEYYTGIFETAGLSPRVVHSTKSSSVIRGLVGAGFGFSLLNICHPDERDGRPGYFAIPLADDVFEPTYGIAYPAAMQHSTLVRAVIETAQTLVRDGGYEHLRLSRLDT